MALRTIRTLGDPVLEKKCREVKELTPRLEELITDMLETMEDAQGVGLAAPQVGVLRRIVVIDVGEREEVSEEETAEEGEEKKVVWPEMPLVIINPEILETEGEQTDSEGCLSVPGKAGNVTRPARVKIRALDENMQPREIEGTGLLARAICHELDHLEGIVYVSRVEGELYDVSDAPEEAEEEA